jgi:hypothetical protein
VIDRLDDFVEIGQQILQGLEDIFGEGSGSAEDLERKVPAECVGGSVIGRSAGAEDGVACVVSGDDAAHVWL